jgi:hypothetical protein
VRHAQTLDRLTGAVRELLPPALARHCRGTALRAKTLTVFVDSSVWTTRLRFYQHNIKNGLGRRLGADIRRMQVKVMPRRPVARIPRREPQRMTTATRRLLHETANGIDDHDLADALRRLGRKP